MTRKPDLEGDFLVLWRLIDGEPPVRPYRFRPGRKSEFDFAWPIVKVAVEIEGGHYSRGRHVRPAGFQRDAEKYNAAVLLGWRLLRYTGDDLKKRSAHVLDEVTQLLGAMR